MDESIIRNLGKLVLKQRNELIMRLLYLAETVITQARDGSGSGIETILNKYGEKVRHRGIRPDYADQTGNLRSSVGYVLYIEGQPYKYDFGNETNGSADGLNLANEVQNTFKAEFQLVFVAGMEYAKHVEDLGYNVLTAYVPTNEVLMREVFSKLKV